jgi:hypothetical protein
MLLYWVLSSGPRSVPSFRDSGSVGDKGVGADLQPHRPTLSSKSVAYFSYVKSKPLCIFFTSMPRKKCKSPKSLIAKFSLRSQSKADMAGSYELVTMIS